MSVILYIAIYLIIINLVGFAMMGIDKSRARKRAWRIPELHLFIVAIIGGSLGTTLGMYFFRHKTRHWYFVFGMPVIFVLQIIIVLAIYFSKFEFIIF